MALHFRNMSLHEDTVQKLCNEVRIFYNFVGEVAEMAA